MLGNFQHNPDRASRILKGVLEMSDYFRSAMHEQRLTPRDGLVSSLMNAQIDGTLNGRRSHRQLYYHHGRGQETTTT